MLEITYDKFIPHPFEVVLSQYFDYEHIAHVHPTTLGEYRIIEQCGSRIVYDQIWPRGPLGRLLRRRRTSRIIQDFFPPNVTTFEFVAGAHRGTKVRTTLTEQAEGTGTLVHEVYLVPRVPNWPPLRPLIKPFMMKIINRVWEEDLCVGVCYGGWPGVPGRTVSPPEALGAPPARERRVIGTVSEFPAGAAKCLRVGDAEIVVIRHGGEWSAVGNRCPHAGGPLALGRVDGETVICPWHGAVFDLKTGLARSGPTRQSIAVYDLSISKERVVIEGK